MSSNWLVCVDASVWSAYAVRFACQNLSKKRDCLCLLYVTQDQTSGFLSHFGKDGRRNKLRAKRVLCYFSCLAQEYKIRRCYMIIARGRHVGEAVCASINKFNIDHTVIGSKGLVDVKRLLVGSTSRYIFEHGNSNIIVMKKHIGPEIIPLDMETGISKIEIEIVTKGVVGHEEIDGKLREQGKIVDHDSDLMIMYSYLPNKPLKRYEVRILSTGTAQIKKNRGLDHVRELSEKTSPESGRVGGVSAKDENVSPESGMEVVGAKDQFKNSFGREGSITEKRDLDMREEEWGLNDHERDREGDWSERKGHGDRMGNERGRVNSGLTRFESRHEMDHGFDRDYVHSLTGEPVHGQYIKSEREYDFERDRQGKRVESKQIDSKQIDSERMDHERISRPTPERADYDRAPPEQMDHNRAPPERVDYHRAPPERVDYDHAPPERVDYNRAPPERVDYDRVPPERIEHDRIDRTTPERMEHDRAPPERIEHDRINRATPERMEYDRNNHATSDRMEHNRIDRATPERIEHDRIDLAISERMEQDRIDRATPERIEHERTDHDRIDHATPERMDQDRIDRDKIGHEGLDRDSYRNLYQSDKFSPE
eukprot:TRINITY_DN7755_c0_g1_i3.p1 TRINITY_DN7755_c0_g1~~TRINITY_DN7755_c0_g1_i3.p1  ORF type:complete len:598 (-),score=67.13 TRINITY_DN7755_c0_g1_i3:123-1916(-)